MDGGKEEKEEMMDGWSNGWTDGQMDRWTDIGRMGEWISRLSENNWS